MKTIFCPFIYLYFNLLTIPPCKLCCSSNAVKWVGAKNRHVFKENNFIALSNLNEI